MALSPDDIERRTFAVAPEGYDVDEVRTFLADVAATVRDATAEHPSGPGATPQADVTRWPERPAAPRRATQEGRPREEAEGPHLEAGATARPPTEGLAVAIAEPADTTPPALGAPGAPGAAGDESATDPDAAGPLGPHQPAPDAYTHLGFEVAELLRSTHETADSLRTHAEASAQERLRDAEREARLVLLAAQSDAHAVHDQAKRVLTTAQEQADAIVADAEYAAREILASAASHAEEYTRATTERARRHADEVLRAERDALARLREAQAGVSAAIDRISRSDDRPVVDLRRDGSDLRFGISSTSGERADGDGAPTGAVPVLDAAGDGSTPPAVPRATTGADATADPARALMRKAVGRAIVAAAETSGPAPSDRIDASATGQDAPEQATGTRDGADGSAAPDSVPAAATAARPRP